MSDWWHFPASLLLLLLVWILSGHHGSTSESDWPKECGTCPAGYCTEIESRVVTKKKASKGHLPWQVRLHRLGGELCGGTIINSQWIVCAAHCMLKRDVDNPGKMEITAGDFDKSVTEGTEATYYAHSVIPHEGFNKSHMFENDIGLIRTTKPIQFSSYIRPICYPSKSESFGKDDHCVVSGWGSYIQDDQQSSNVLRYQSIEIWPDKECNESDSSYSKGQVWKGMMCAGFRKTRKQDLEKCTTLGSGDSGGPFACKSKKSESWKLAGIVSSSGYCQEDSYTPAQFTKAASFVDWIEVT